MGTTQSTISGNIGFSLLFRSYLKHNCSLPDIELFFREFYFFFVAGVKKRPCLLYFYRFAADPSSYETTVRNLFTLSHLINRQEVTLVFDTIDQPYIYPKKLKDRSGH